MQIAACHSCALDGMAAKLTAIMSGAGVAAEVKTAASTLMHHVRERCLNCQRVRDDDIRIAHTPHTISEIVPATPPAMDADGDNVTPLDEGNEARLRMALSTLFALSPVQLLLVQHLLRGNRLSQFGNALKSTHLHIARYRGNERAQAGMMRRAIEKAAPFLAPVFSSLIHAKKLDFDEVSDDLFSFAGLSSPISAERM